MPFVPIAQCPPPWIFGISAMLGEGSVILPGNFGRVMRAQAAWHGQAAMQLRTELVIEETRQAVMPEAPSRLDCLFVSPDLAAASAFADAHPQMTNLLYAVEPTQPLERVFLADLFLPRATDPLSFSQAELLATAFFYWHGPPQAPRVEMLLTSPIRILGSISDAGR